MTVDAVQGRPPKVRSFFSRTLEAIEYPTDRVVLAALFASLFCLDYGARFFGHSAGELFITSANGRVTGAALIGLVAIAVVLKDLKAETVLRSWDYAAIIGIAIVLIHPWPSMGSLAISVLGLLFVGRNDKRLASLGQLCIGFAWIVLWGPVVMGLIEQWLLPIETALAYAPLSMFGSFSFVGNVIFGPNGHDVMVLERCSAFRNTIVMAFVWLSMLKILRLEFRLWYFAVLAMGLAVVVLLNTARIGLMAYSYHLYVFWHYGPGATISKLVILTAVVSIFYFGLRAKPSLAK